MHPRERHRFLLRVLLLRVLLLRVLLLLLLLLLPELHLCRAMALGRRIGIRQEVRCHTASHESGEW
jgi:hypothetical protein